MQNNVLGQKLKEARFYKKASQADVAKDLNMVESSYSKYEQGKNEPSLDTLIILARYFNVTTDFLLGLED